MADGTHIEWTDATWNPITGCSVVSPGCTNCYAMKLAGGRLQHHPSRAGLTSPSKAGPVWNGQVRLNADWLDQPLRWTRPRRIFVCAHGDLFHEAAPDTWIDQVFAVMALAPHHTFQVLTKRSARARAYLSHPDVENRICKAIDAIDRTGAAWFFRKMAASEQLRAWPLPNVWLGTSVERPDEDRRIADLLATPAAIRFVSAEPLLAALDLRWALSRNRLDIAAGFLERGQFSPGLETLRGIDQVIVGGESGPDSRPMHPDWARRIRDDCAWADRAFFFKQWGAWREAFNDEDADHVHDVEIGTDEAAAFRLAAGRSPVWVTREGAVYRRERDIGRTPARLMTRIGKHADGYDRLDGAAHKAFPEPLR